MHFAAVLQKLVGPEISISSMQISSCTALLGGGLQTWRTRPLDETFFLILDAHDERVDQPGSNRGPTCQMSRAYSAMVRSEENGPMPATLRKALCAQASGVR